MLTVPRVRQDIMSLCQLIDDDRWQDADSDELQRNFAINESLAFMRESLVRIAKSKNKDMLMDDELQSSLVDLLDIITLKCKYHLN